MKPAPVDPRTVDFSWALTEPIYVSFEDLPKDVNEAIRWEMLDALISKACGIERPKRPFLWRPR